MSRDRKYETPLVRCYRFLVKVNTAQRRSELDFASNGVSALRVRITSETGTWSFARVAFRASCLKYFAGFLNVAPLTVWTVEPNI